MESTVTARGTCHLACGDAAEALAMAPAGIAVLGVSSPPYLGLIDYAEAARASAAARDAVIWHAGTMSPIAYLDAMSSVLAQLERVLTPDAILALEIGDVRIPRSGGTLAPLPDWWLALCEGFGFRLLERIAMVRPLALGRRSGNFKRINRPGYALLDTVTSTLLVVGRGDPLRRLRERARAEDAIETAWAERFLRTMWMTARPRRRTVERIGGHPVPSDRECVRALVRFYSCRGDLVCDPFAGSGVIGEVAADEGRQSLLCERERVFADQIATALGGRGVTVAPLEALEGRRRVVVPSSQLHLSLPDAHELVARRAFLRDTPGAEVTPRYQAMARDFALEYGIAVTPEMVALFHRMERRYVLKVGRERYAEVGQPPAA